MLYEKPNLITESIVQRIINENPIYLYSFNNKVTIGNVLCIGSIVLIFIFLIYKNMDKQNIIKNTKLKQLYEQQQQEKQQQQLQQPHYNEQLSMYEPTPNYIQPVQNIPKRQQYLNIRENLFIHEYWYGNSKRVKSLKINYSKTMHSTFYRRYYYLNNIVGVEHNFLLRNSTPEYFPLKL